MELLNDGEIKLIAERCGFSKVLACSEEFPNKITGYLSDHLNLIIEVESNGCKSLLNLFVKYMPQLNGWKAEYLKETEFFKKEYTMLNTLFKEFDIYTENTDSQKWRPQLLFIKEDIFVFENVSLLGYEMPHHQDTMTYEELKATVTTLARFHSQSYIYEERKSKELGRLYRIWEQYSDYLQEPCKAQDWRDTGRDAVMDYLKVFSKHKSKENFYKCVELVIPSLFDRALDIMKPSSDLRNVVVHRDLWTNNIFLKKKDSVYHALFVDFQTVVYSSPMLDLSSLIYFNTTRGDRNNWTYKFIDIYYTVLSAELQAAGVGVKDIFDLSTLIQEYDKSVLFGITQAALITPIVAMSGEIREQILNDPELSRRANVVTRSKVFIDIAKKDEKYQTRITELFDEILERYVPSIS